MEKIETRDELKKLLRWLAAHQPDVYRLARVIAYYGDVDPKDQAWRLCLSLNEIYDLRRRLKEAALRFRKITKI